MSAGRIFLCASFALATPAAAQEAASFVTQLRFPARGVTLDVFAWRGADGVAVDASALAALGIAAPSARDPIPLSAIPGLRYEEPPGAAAIIITCTTACYEQQHIDLGGEAATVTPASGGYINYELDAQWVDAEGVSAAGVAEAALFGRWGLIESSWIAQTRGEAAGATRLETSWTIDRPRDGVRMRIGDSTMVGASGAPVRFGGLQIGRYFGLTPSLITYPTPALSGEAATASTIELYVDGALRARNEVAAGPFVIEHAPVVSGAGEAELVITDILGREQTITRPFFVSTTMLRRGLSDWSAALGAERRAFGRENANYGDNFAVTRYRRGITETLTLETSIEYSGDSATVQAGAAFATVYLGQAYLSRAQSGAGGFTTASWFYDARAWSVGLQAEQRDGDFHMLGRDGSDNFRRGVAGNMALNLGDYGSLAFTAAQVGFENKPAAQTLALSYSPDMANAGLSLRVLYTDREESELSAGVSLSFALGGDVSGHLSIDSDARGVSYRANAQRAVTPERAGWRARVAAGAVERIDLAVLSRGALGDSMAQFVHANGAAGVRLRHAGSAGWIEGIPFAGRNIDGAFAVVDAGAPGVAVTRNRLNAGVTGGDGRLLATNLRPYGLNTIGIEADDLPFDRAIASPLRYVTPAEGAGVVVRFTDAREQLMETRVQYAGGATPPRGAVLLRQRDGERFPVGSDGRVVLQGAAAGDVLQLEGNGVCTARADEDAAGAGLTLICAVVS